jgi:hypothetical protein
LYTSIAESHDIYIYIVWCRQVCKCVFPSGRLEHVFIFTAM